MSQQVTVSRGIEFKNQGLGTPVQRIDCDDHANIIYWRPVTDDTGALYIGDGTTDMDVKIFLGSAAVSVLFDVGNARMTLAGVDIATDAPVVITDTTESTSTSTGALIVSGGIANAKDTYLGDDVFLTSGAVLNWNAGDVTITHASNLLTIEGGGLTMGATGVPAGDFILWATQAGSKVWLDVDADTNGAFYFGANDYGIDVSFYGQTIANSMVWDASANALIFTAAGLTFGTTSKLVLPVKASGSTTQGDLWFDTDDNYLHFYSNANGECKIDWNAA